MKNKFLLFLLAITLTTACKKKNYYYEVNEVEVNPNNANKDKLKSTEQFVSILYSNLFQQAASPTQIAEMSALIRSIGDKQLAYETVVAKLMEDGAFSFPSSAEMHGNLEAFITETYKRFYVRLPSEVEKAWWVNYLESRPEISSELVYYAFVTSNEYYFY